MSKNFINAHTVLGSGLGGATGLAVNRLVLGNKSLLSNLLATGVGGALGGVTGYFLNKYMTSPMDALDRSLATAKPGERIPDEVLLAVKDSVGGKLSEDESVALRNKLANVYTAAEIHEMYNAAERAQDSFALRGASRLGSGAVGGVGADLLYRGGRKLLGLAPKDLKEKTFKLIDGQLKYDVTLDPASKLIRLSRKVRDNSIPISLTSVTDPRLANRLADELAGDSRVAQGLSARLFGTPLEREQAQFIHDHVTKHRLSRAGIGRFNLTNAVRKIKHRKTRNVIRRLLNNMYVHRGTKLGALKSIRPLAIAAGAGAGLWAESAYNDYDTGLVNRLRNLP